MELRFEKNRRYNDGVESGWCDEWLDSNGNELGENAPNYSGNLELALSVVEKLKKDKRLKSVEIKNYRDLDQFTCYWVNFQTYGD